MPHVNKKSKLYYAFVYTLSQLLIVLMGVFCVLLARGNIRFLNSGLIIIVLAFAASEALKAIFKLPRPKKHLLPQKVDTSFPSTHSTVAFAASFAYFYYGGNLVIFFTMLTLATLVALGRVLSGAHYPRDVVAGAVVALVVAVLTYNLDLQIYVGL